MVQEILNIFVFFISGWLFKMELSDMKELDNLMSEDQYTEFLKKTEH